MCRMQRTSRVATGAGPLKFSGYGSLEVWHKRLAHINYATVKRMINSSCVTGMNVIASSLNSTCECIACMKGKFRRMPFRTDDTPVEPLSHVHVDVSGPYPTALNRDRYFLLFRDKCTGYTITHTSVSKVSTDFVKYCIGFLERQTPYVVKNIRSDQGTEFVNESLTKFFTEKGIKHQTTSIDSSASNGVAERLNLTIMNCVRATMADSNMCTNLWNYSVGHVVHALNRVPAAGKDKCPYELMFNKVPDIAHLRAFGTKCVSWNPKSHQLSKLHPRGEAGYMVGYHNDSTSMYLVSTG